MAHDTRWVKLILPFPVASRCLLMMRRFSSRVRTGMVRSEVAVGTARLASMFSAMRRAPPRMGWAMSPGRMAATATARGFGAATGPEGSVRATAVLLVGEDAVAAGVAAAAGSSAGRPVIRSKYSRQLTSTVARSCRYCSSRSRANA